MVFSDVLGSLLPEDRQGRIGLGVGGSLLALGFLDSDAQRGPMFKASGVAVLAYFLLRSRQGTFASSSEIEQDAALPAGNSGVTLQEQWNGIVGRAIGIEPPVGIQDHAERAADPSAGPFLGTPKNALRVAGAWIQPVEGAAVNVALFSDTFQAFANIENQSSVEVAGQVRVRITHSGLLQSGAQQTYADGPFLRLAPGELRQLEMRLPIVRDADGSIELALLFANYNLASVKVRRSLVLS